jgi:hypothetical protein
MTVLHVELKSSEGSWVYDQNIRASRGNCGLNVACPGCVPGRDAGIRHIFLLRKCRLSAGPFRRVGVVRIG